MVPRDIIEKGTDQQNQELTVGVQEQRTHQVPDLLQGQTLGLGEVDGVDVGEGGVVAEHFDVDGPDEVLLLLLEGEVGLVYVLSDLQGLLGDHFVLLLFGASLPDGLNQL